MNNLCTFIYVSTATKVISNAATFAQAASGKELGGMLKKDVPSVWNKAKGGMKKFHANNGGFVNPGATVGGSSANENLNWSVISKKTGETRLEHVKLHESNNLQKASHGVFYGDAENTINKAWKNKSSGVMISEGSTDMYIIPYENAGYAGGYTGQGQNINTVTIITKHDSNQIITGFPGNGYSYSEKGLISN